MGWILLGVLGLLLYEELKKHGAAVFSSTAPSPAPQASPGPLPPPAKTTSGDEPWIGDVYSGGGIGGLDVSYQAGAGQGGQAVWGPRKVMDFWTQEMMTWFSQSKISNPRH